MPVVKWEAKNEDLREYIIRSLEREKTWTNLWNNVKHKIKSKTTLSLYLKALEKQGHVLRREVKDEGRLHTYYSLVKTAYVRGVLGERPGKRLIHAVVELNKLTEREFLSLACRCASSQLLNVFHYYMLGEKTKEHKEGSTIFLKACLSNLVESVRLQGKYLAGRIKEGSFDSDRLWEARERLRKKYRAESIELARVTKSREDLTKGGVRPLKISIGEIKVSSRDVISAKDLGLKRIHTLTLSPREKEILAVAKLSEEGGGGCG